MRLLPSRTRKPRGGVGWEEVERGVEFSLEHIELKKLLGGSGGDIHEDQGFYLNSGSS